MLLTIVVLVIASLCDVTSSSNADHAYGVILLPEPIYDSVESESQLVSNTSGSGQSIRVKIRNSGDDSEDVGFHAYLPDSADMTSFSMKSEGFSYKAKKLDRKMAEGIMKKANEEDHNAAVYIPKPLLDSYDDEIQTAGNTVHIKRQHEMTFDLSYSENLRQMITEDVKIQNRARVSLDLYGTKVEELSVELSSPNYPNSYPNNADVTWWVRVPGGKAVSLQIEDLDIEECCDRLVIYDGASIRDHIISEVTGSLSELTTRQYQSTFNSIFLRLVSDCSKTSGGFKVSAAAVVTASTPRPPLVTQTVPININSTDGNTTNDYHCSGTNYLSAYPNDYTYLSSPGYPTSYYNNLYCSWRIQAYWNYNVRLTVVDMQLEQGFDYVYVYDGSSSNYPLLVRLTANDSADVYSTGTYMYVNFVTDGSVTFKGFSMQYTASYGPATTTTNYPEVTSNAGPIYCGDHIELYYSSGHIYSPNYPNYYDANSRCSWYIHGHYSDRVVYLNVNYMYLAYGDVVTMYEGSSYEILRNCTSYSYCSSVSIYSKGPSMSISFTSDNNYEGQGFDLYYSSYYSPTYTNVETTEQSFETTSSNLCSGVTQFNAYSYPQSFTSPGYPYNYYDNMDCSWRIYSSYFDYIVQLSVADMDLESCCDKLYIYDGYSSSYNRIAVLTGTSNGNGTYYSSGSYMYLSFTTDSSFTHKGFRLEYMAVSSEVSTVGYEEADTTTSGETTCGSGNYISISSNEYGYINSPNYPGYYSRNTQCSWTIYCDDYNSVVRLSIYSLSLERYDEVDAYDGTSQYYNHLFHATHGSSLSSSVYSSGRYMYITFTSDDYYESTGFNFRYQATYGHETTEADFTTVASQTIDDSSVAVDVNVCDTVHYIYDYDGYIYSSNYPNYYPNNLNECWYFPNNYYDYHHHYHFRVSSFSTEEYRDILYINSTISGVHNQYSGYQYSGQDWNSPYDTGLYLRFVTDNANTYSGFQLHYYWTT